MNVNRIFVGIVGIAVVVLGSHVVAKELDRLGSGPKIRAMEYGTIEAQGELLFVNSSLSSTFASNCVMENFKNSRILGPYSWEGDLICGGERYKGMKVSIDLKSKKSIEVTSGNEKFKKDKYVFDWKELIESSKGEVSTDYVVIGKMFRVDIEFRNVLKFPNDAEIVIIVH